VSAAPPDSGAEGWPSDGKMDWMSDEGIQKARAAINEFGGELKGPMELKEALAKLNEPSASRAAENLDGLRALFDDGDADGNGIIDFPEFLGLLGRLSSGSIQKHTPPPPTHNPPPPTSGTQGWPSGGKMLCLVLEKAKLSFSMF